MALTYWKLFKHPLRQYDALGGIKGSIQAAVDAALKAADADPTIPKDSSERLALLRSAFIPALAGVDRETRAARRRVARISEIPEKARGLINCLVDARLLATDSPPGPARRSSSRLTKRCCASGTCCKAG